MKKGYGQMGLFEFQRRFRTEAACRKHLFKMRWPDGFKCPRCGHGECFNLPKRKLHQCKSCGHQASVTAGTVMHRTRTPLRKWFWAIYLVSGDKRGLSALSLSKKLKVSYYVAWTMLHKIRQAMADRNRRYQLRGVIEIDESFYGGKNEGGKRGRGTSKAPVMIEASTFEVDEGGRGLGFARMRVIDHVDGKTVGKVIKSDVAPGQRIITDGWASYNEARKLGHDHSPEVSGSDKAGEALKWVHILASNSKAFLLGTFHGIGRKHLQSYLDEFCYRFNRRRWEDELFDRLATACANSKGVTYSELTA